MHTIILWNCYLYGRYGRLQLLIYFINKVKILDGYAYFLNHGAGRSEFQDYGGANHDLSWEGDPMLSFARFQREVTIVYFIRH